MPLGGDWQPVKCLSNVGEGDGQKSPFGIDRAIKIFMYMGSRALNFQNER